MTKLLEMSLTGGILIAVVVILRAVAINRLPKNVFLALWAAALTRLLLPFSFSSPASIWTAAQYAGVDVRRAGVLLSRAPAGGAAQAGSPVPVPLLIWAGGALLCALIFLSTHLLARRRYRAALPLDDPAADAWLADNRLRRPVSVRVSDQITSPLTYGLLRPVILLPKCLDHDDPERLSYVLAHELCHIRRFDGAWKWLLAAALCLHWFNPLVWVMYLLANRDLKLSCDQQVLRRYGSGSRASYARTLVSLEEKRAYFSPLASNFAKSAMEERIIAIMKDKKATITGIAVGLVLVIAVTVIFATGAIPLPTAASMPKPSAATPQPNLGQFSTAGSATFYKNYGLPAWQSGSVIETAMVTDVRSGRWGGDEAPRYTQEQYDMVLKALKLENYAKMSIAEFNRTVHKILEDSYSTEPYERSLGYAYELVLSSLPDSDPNAAYLLNTVQASLTEYSARIDEVYSGKTVDPSFSGSAQRCQEQDVYGDMVRTHTFYADYTFTYRILDQDGLTVAERDAFLQAVMQGAQDYLDSRTVGQLIDDKDPEASFKAALEKAGKAASNGEIEFTGCEVSYYADYC